MNQDHHPVDHIDIIVVAALSTALFWTAWCKEWFVAGVLLGLLVFAFLLALLRAWTHRQHHQHERHADTMTALEELTSSVQANTAASQSLATAVDAAVVELNSEDASDAQLLALRDAVAANTAGVEAQAKRLTDAVNGPTP